MTHDPGERLSWTLRPTVSKKMENWQKKRATMKQVCGNCHDQQKWKKGIGKEEWEKMKKFYEERYGK